MIETTDIITQVLSLGASLAGIAPVDDLRQSPSYEIYDRSPYYEGYHGVAWPKGAQSVLVIALAHDPSEPQLDWWSDVIPGRTPGNRMLMSISRKSASWLQKAHGIIARPLPYPVEKGGIFLKDAAVLAGLGVIGRNNLLVTPRFGTRVRLRALFLDRETGPSAQLAWNPCAGCAAPCHAACPEKAFRGGFYDVMACHREMERNRHRLSEIPGESVGVDNRCMVTKFCRACELACPVAADGSERVPDL
ncbi:epoxyqueuosine reductase [bacterium]|nr:epoxyqueuosine reductase [bacterium]